MEHIYRNHMAPAASGKSYFSTTSRNQVRNLVLSQFHTPMLVNHIGGVQIKYFTKSASLYHRATRSKRLTDKPNLCGDTQAESPHNYRISHSIEGMHGRACVCADK